MASNSLTALQNSFDTWKEKRFPNPPKGFNAFQYFCIEQFARSYDLGDSQLRSGIVDGGGDGGVDAFYILANGELVDSETELKPDEAPEFTLILMQLKGDEGFSPKVVDRFIFFTDDLLNLSRKKADYHSTYHSDLISAIRVFKDKFGIVVGQSPPLAIEYIYVVKKDSSPNRDCNQSVKKICETCTKYFPHCKPNFRFVNATALWNQVQARPPRKKCLIWDSQPMAIREGNIGLVRLTEYYKFLKEKDGTIAERFFDSNVRGYWPTSGINREIAKTLKTPADNPEFWLLNNGITILAEKVGQGSNYLEMEIHDPQIVNGLQTSRQIFSHFSSVEAEPADMRRVLVRLITINDKKSRDAVIRCTNSQNPMPDEALRATDAIHRMLETQFHSVNLYYDRRKGYYRDQGKQVSQIVSVIDVLQGIVSIVLQRPDDARGRPRDYIRKTDLYNTVFGEEIYDLKLYIMTTQICRRVADFLDAKRLETIHRRNILFYLSMYLACELAGTGYPVAKAIQNIDLPEITNELLEYCFEKVFTQYEQLTERYAVSPSGEKDYDSIAKGSGQYLVNSLLDDLRGRLRQTTKSSSTK